MKDLTPEQEQALKAFSEANGRKWKSELATLWLTARAPSILHSLRNTHGPKWLKNYRLPS